MFLGVLYPHPYYIAHNKWLKEWRKETKKLISIPSDVHNKINGVVEIVYTSIFIKFYQTFCENSGNGLSKNCAKKIYKEFGL